MEPCSAGALLCLFGGRGCEIMQAKGADHGMDARGLQRAHQLRCESCGATAADELGVLLSGSSRKGLRGDRLVRRLEDCAAQPLAGRAARDCARPGCGNSCL